LKVGLQGPVAPDLSVITDVESFKRYVCVMSVDDDEEWIGV